MEDLLKAPSIEFPLHVACYNSNKVEALRLIPSSDVNQLDNTGRTPLMYASGYAEMQPVVKALLEKGANAAAISRKGKITALSYAYENSNFEIADLLLRYGANPNVMSNEGETPSDILLRKYNESKVGKAELRAAKANNNALKAETKRLLAKLPQSSTCTIAGGRKRKQSRRKTKKIRRRSSRR